MGGRHLTDEMIEDALRKTLGIQADAAKKLGCGRDTICTRVKASRHLQEVIAEMAETRQDYAEHALYRAIIKGEPWAVRLAFQFSPVARRRGYAETSEVNLHTSPLSDVPTEELERIVAEGRKTTKGGAAKKPARKAK